MKDTGTLEPSSIVQVCE